MAKWLLSTLVMTLFVCVSNAQTHSLGLNVSASCSALLTPRWAHNQHMISQTVVGSGTAYLITPKEFSAALGFAPRTQARIQVYADSPNRHHRAAFVLLPDTASPLGNTLASTYADNPSRYLAFSKGNEWLATNLRQFEEQLPQHLVLMSHRADAFVALHEVIHLEDFDEIYDYAAAKNGTAYLMRMDIFTILSELHAYQEQFRMIHAENPLGALAAAEGLSRDLQKQVGPSFMALDKETHSELKKIVGLNGQGLEDYRRYLTTGPAFRAWSEILPELNSELFKEYAP